jgi:hypothetical protein
MAWRTLWVMNTTPKPRSRTMFTYLRATAVWRTLKLQMNGDWQIKSTHDVR